MHILGWSSDRSWSLDTGLFPASLPQQVDVLPRCLGPLPERAAKYCERYMKPGRIGRIAVGRVSRDAGIFCLVNMLDILMDYLRVLLDVDSASAMDSGAILYRGNFRWVRCHQWADCHKSQFRDFVLRYWWFNCDLMGFFMGFVRTYDNIPFCYLT